MVLSDHGRMILEWLCILYRHNDTIDNLTEPQIEAAVKKEASRYPEISADESALIVRKLMALVGVFKPEDECVVDSSAYDGLDKDWFTKIKADHDEWFTAYSTRLLQKQWSPNVIRELDKSSDAIMNHLGNPKSAKFNVRGLVMGDIQSGKTANFIALCNKAADAGYRVIIITAGVIEKLRRQTQGRLEKEFINLLPLKQVVKLTGATYDFRKEQGENPVHVFRDDVPVLCVVKKNVSVLQHLYKWLQKGVKTVSAQGDVTLPWPLLFIDDEADNASINTKELSEEANPTRTNELIRKILKSFTRSSYVGITATPFANVFIDPDSEDKVVADDLFPRSFVYRLTTPSNYFGASKLFEPGAPYLKVIDDIEYWLPASHKKDEFPSEDLPKSLRTAIGYYLLVNGVMDVIGKSGDHIGHRSMMIHVSRFVAIQNRLLSHVEDYVKRLVSRVSNYCGDPRKAERSPELKQLHEIWDEYGLSRACEGMPWSTFLKTVLLDSIKTIETVVVNSGRTVRSLDYTDADKRYIVIGGNALSRGLTLEGLVVSYFRRNTMMSDTLLQMGRWCGYRGLYQGLVRVWMPQDAVDNFGYASDISEDLSEMFHQIVEQEGSPKDFAFKIRKSPGAMLPTARNKMRTATRVSFPIVLAGHSIETPRVKNDPEVTGENDRAVCSFINNNIGRLEKERVWDNMRFLRNVPPEEVTKMLSSFKAGMMSFGFMVPQIADYISNLGSAWDVAIPIAKNGEEAYEGTAGVPLLLKVRKAQRKLSVVSSKREVMISGTKLKVSSGGVMRHILSREEAQRVVVAYQAVKGNEKRQPPDERFLAAAKTLGRRPLLVIQYIEMSAASDGSEKPKTTAFFALSFGFPGAKDDMVEQEYYFTRRAYEESSLQDYFNAEEES